jgi:hypothetical protein
MDWPFVAKILHIGGQPVCDYVGTLRENQLKEQDVTRASLHQLLRREGYAFGIVWNPTSLSVELDEMGRKTYLFVRDPREVVSELQARSNATPTSEFVRAPQVAAFSIQCRRLAEFCRDRRQVQIIRIEDLTSGWTRLVSNIVETLGLNTPPDAALSPSRSRAVTPHTTLKSSHRERFDLSSRTFLDETCA